MSHIQSPTDEPRANVVSATERRRGRLGGVLAPLGNRNFRLLIGGQLVSNVGDMFYAVALPWYMLTGGGGAADLGLVLVANGVPRIGTTLIGGSLADRLRPRRVMLAADVARAIATGVLAALILLGRPELWQLCALSAVLGAFSGLFLPGSVSIVPDLVPDEQLQAGNAFNASSAQIATLAGAALGGLVVTVFNPGIALAVDAGTFVVSALSLAAMRIRRAVATASTLPEAPTLGSEDDASAPESAEPMSFGRLLRTSRLLRVVLIVATIGNLTVAGMTEVALPDLAKQLPHGSATGFGIMVTAFGAGALLGGLGAGALGGLRRRGILMMLLWAVQAALIGAIPFGGSVAAVAGALAGVGLTNGLSNVFALTVIQQKMPRALLGRVMGVLMLTSLGAYPISVAVAGEVTQQYGPTIIFVVCGALLLVATLYGFFQRELREI